MYLNLTFFFAIFFSICNFCVKKKIGFTASTAATTSKVYIAPVQTQIQVKIELVNSDLVGLFQRDKNDLLTEEQSKELQDKKKLKKDLEK